MFLRFSALLLLTACLSELPELPGFKFSDRPDEDYDLDGFSENEGDCDDQNALRTPAMLEICDGIDNNCDDIIDNDALDATVFYLDSDADGVIDGVVAESVDASLLFQAVDGAGQSATSSPLVLSTAADRRTVVARGGTVFIDNDGDSVTLFLVSPADGFSAVIVDPGGFRVEVQFVPLQGDATSFVVCEINDGLVCTTG